jgi:hypothetical protein
MRYFSSLAVIGLVAITACGGEMTPPPPFEPAEAAKRPKEPKGPGQSDAPADEGAPVPDEVDPNGDVDPTLPPGMPPPDTAWIGTLASTEWVTFGGEPFCTYRVRLVDVRVNVRLTATGRIVTTFVSGTAVEEGLNGCGNQPIPPNLHRYTYSPAAPTEGAFTAKNVPGNKPAAEMAGEVLVTDPTTGRATLRWRRTDAKAPLDWVITAQVPLKKT